MAAEEKTEEPTAKKRSDARKKGNIPKSRDLASAMILLAAIYLLRYLGPYVGEYMMKFLVKVYTDDVPNIIAPERKEVLPHILDWVLWMTLMIGPFMAMSFLIAYLVHYYQVGFMFTTEPLSINFNKLNPVSGLKRVFSTQNIVTLIMNLAKMAAVLGVAWFYMYTEFQNSLTMVEMGTEGTLVYTADRVLNLARNMALLLLVIGFADFSYQKWKNNKGLKMTKQEVKEEFKQMEGDPMVKQKRRQKQMEMAMKRMMGEVPQAEVVVRNPTHFAVAISYKPGMAAPVVVAKGKDKIAERIIAAAREAGVPLVENPPLARQLYKMVEVGDVIPEDLFATVAEVLASVMDAEKKRAMMSSLAGAA